MNGGVRPAAFHSANTSQGGDDSENCSSRSPSVCRLFLWRCSSHDGLKHRPAALLTASSSSFPTSSSLSARQTRESGALLRFLRFLRRCFWTRSDRRASAGRLQQIGDPERGRDSWGMPPVSTGNVTVWPQIRVTTWGIQSCCNGDFGERSSSHVLRESRRERRVQRLGTSASTAGGWGETFSPKKLCVLWKIMLTECLTWNTLPQKLSV